VTLSREIASRLKRTADLERQLVDMARVNQ
jgi:hypothetical protein